MTSWLISLKEPYIIRLVSGSSNQHQDSSKQTEQEWNRTEVSRHILKGKLFLNFNSSSEHKRFLSFKTFFENRIVVFIKITHIGDYITLICEKVLKHWIKRVFHIYQMHLPETIQVCKVSIPQNIITVSLRYLACCSDWYIQYCSK